MSTWQDKLLNNTNTCKTTMAHALQVVGSQHVFRDSAQVRQRLEAGFASLH